MQDPSILLDSETSKSNNQIFWSLWSRLLGGQNPQSMPFKMGENELFMFYNSYFMNKKLDSALFKRMSSDPQMISKVLWSYISVLSDSKNHMGLDGT